MITVAHEALIDLIVDADGHVDPRLGGAGFNVTRAVARLGRPVAYLGRLSGDRFGQLIRANLVFRDGRAVALIDFDLAGPGSAIWDLAAAARYWAPLQDEQDITDSRQGRGLERFGIFLHASGLGRADRRRVAEAVVANHDWTYAIVTEAAAAGHEGFADHWRMVAEQATRARSWCRRYQHDLVAAAR